MTDILGKLEMAKVTTILRRREQYLATVHISQIDQQWTFTLISGLFVQFFYI
jgi:hypothetical protein